MSGARFTSAFAADLEGYLAFKQNMGCYGASRIWYLRQFDAWCAEHGRTVFDQGTVEGWVRARLESSRGGSRMRRGCSTAVATNGPGVLCATREFTPRSLGKEMG